MGKAGDSTVKVFISICRYSKAVFLKATLLVSLCRQMYVKAHDVIALNLVRVPMAVAVVAPDPKQSSRRAGLYSQNSGEVKMILGVAA